MVTRSIVSPVFLLLSDLMKTMYGRFSSPWDRSRGLGYEPVYNLNMPFESVVPCVLYFRQGYSAHVHTLDSISPRASFSCPPAIFLMFTISPGSRLCAPKEIFTGAPHPFSLGAE